MKKPAIALLAAALATGCARPVGTPDETSGDCADAENPCPGTPDVQDTGDTDGPEET